MKFSSFLSHTLARALESLITMDESQTRLRLWGGLRSAFVAATRMLELGYVLQDQQSAASGPGSQRCAMPELDVRLRLRFPQVIGGGHTHWLTIVKLAMNGVPGATVNERDKFSCCPLFDCSLTDPNGAGERDSSFDLLVLRLRVGDNGFERSYRISERFILRYRYDGNGTLVCAGINGETSTSLRFMFSAT